jgi:hypothetical protein
MTLSLGKGPPVVLGGSVMFGGKPYFFDEQHPVPDNVLELVRLISMTIRWGNTLGSGVHIVDGEGASNCHLNGGVAIGRGTFEQDLDIVCGTIVHEHGHSHPYYGLDMALFPRWGVLVDYHVTLRYLVPCVETPVDEKGQRVDAWTRLVRALQHARPIGEKGTLWDAIVRRAKSQAGVK